ncbi:hypothetical protein BJ165DRAFT_1467572 [Panaeolus papilionaceus]|nr:hypothetical protein BJ165DRAFT_1467572 [Panaeolus papilionaceus]
MFSLVHFFLLLSLNVAVKCQTPVPPSTFPPFSSAQTPSPTLISANSSSRPASSVSTTSTSSIPFPSLGGYSPCVTNCLAMGIARVNCTSIVDVNCFCAKDNFTSELVACILANCAEEIHTAEDLARQFCHLASGTPSLSFPSVPTTTTSSSSISSTTSGSSSVTSPPSTPSTGGSAQLRLLRAPLHAEAPLIALMCTVSALMFGLYLTL